MFKKKPTIYLISILFALSIGINNNLWANTQKSQITNISIQKLNNNYSLNFKLTKKVKYKIFTLTSPNRLVIDFDKTSLKTNFKTGSSSIFSLFRTSVRGSGNRVVFHLKEKIGDIKQFNSFNDNSWQIVVNFTKENIILKNNQDQKSLSRLIDDKVFPKNKAKNKAKNINKKIKSNPKIKNSNKKIIVLDAGHGGKDPGAIGRYRKTKEKDVSLSFALEIKRFLEKNGDFKVYLTRDRDYFVSLSQRVVKSQKLKADLFISIHADSALNKKAQGLSIYTLSEKSSDKQAQRLASKENKSDIIGGINLSSSSEDVLKTLIALSQRSTMNSSVKFAEFAIKEISKSGIKIKQHTHRFAGFKVLTAPDVPSILIELGYLSNNHDERKLISASYRKKFAMILSKIISEYFS